MKFIIIIYNYDYLFTDKRLSLLKDSAKIEALLRGMAKDWRSLGTQLLFSKEALDQIASVPGHATIHLNKLLNKWLLGDGASPTISVLVNALYSMKGKDKYVESILKGTGTCKSILYLYYYLQHMTINNTLMSLPQLPLMSWPISSIRRRTMTRSMVVKVTKRTSCRKKMKRRL